MNNSTSDTPNTDKSSQRYDADYCERLIQQVKREAYTSELTLLVNFLKELSSSFDKDVLLYASPYVTGSFNLGSDQRASVNDYDLPALASAMKGMGKRDLLLIVHSSGGDGNAAAQFVEYLRKKYTGKKITAIVPHKAMSAATMICMGCDEIIMSKFASLGPIDPQLNGIPASSIMLELDRALKDVDENERRANIWAPRLMNLPPGIYQLCENAIKYAEERVSEWLAHYMLKGRKPKSTAKSPASIAKWLADGTDHKSHGRPLTYDLLKEKGINVILMEDDDDMQNLVMGVFHAFRIFFDNNPCCKIILNQDGDGELLIKSKE
ncbi:MAG: hypothetical protein RR506_08705 [Akkermansia sp.]